VPALDEFRNQKRGAVTHSYSISSAPFETIQKGFLEFYVILEMHEEGFPGRLTESLFQVDPQQDNKIIYFDKITGDFRLDKRASGFENVVLVGTGSGLAPFASMIKQLHFDASQGKRDRVKYTLFHTNRGYQELGYHQELCEIEASQRFDFLYVASVSRPSPQALSDARLGRGRANNLLRSVFEMPVKEEQDLREASARGEDPARAKAMLDRTVKPELPQHISREMLLERMAPEKTVILCCGNPLSMTDVKYIADANRIQFEKEDW
jgi:ferredoxin-NADP reductase